ncbi:MAG: sulfatase-like hydrolase/transferase [Gemmatimonadota bacterium]
MARAEEKAQAEKPHLSAAVSSPIGKRIGLENIGLSLGLALLVVSPPLLQIVTGGYFVFDAMNAFVLPHVKGFIVVFLAIHGVTLICRKATANSKILVILLGAVMLVFLCRGFLATAALSPHDLSQKLQDLLAFLGMQSIDLTTLRRLTVIGLFGLFLLLSPILLRSSSRVLRACAAFGWALGFITIFRFYTVVDMRDEPVATRALPALKAAAPPAARRVVWVIFDEFDYGRIFERRNPKLVLPNLDRLAAQSVTAMNAVSPASSTGISIPSLITGTQVFESIPVGPARLMLKSGDGTLADWASGPTVFSRLLASGHAVSILGFYHPYCGLFPFVEPCISRPPHAYPAWWWGIWRALAVIPGLHLITRRSELNSQEQQAITDVQLQHLDTHLDYAPAALSFLHFNFPHLPGRRSNGITLVEGGKSLPGYDQNVLMVDWTLGKIVERLAVASQGQDILLIISSDHWLRVNALVQNLPPEELVREVGEDRKEMHKVPLMIRRLRETSPHVISQPINTIHTGRLIEDFLAGRVSDHSDIVAWWQYTQYMPPSGVERPAGK